MEGPGGESYTAQLKGANLPALPATILSAAGTARKQEFLISIGDGKTADAVIRLQAPWKGKALLPGTELEFAGKAVELRREPFRLIVDVDPANITLAARAERDKGSICECHTEDEWRRIQAGEKVPRASGNRATSPPPAHSAPAPPCARGWK